MSKQSMLEIKENKSTQDFSKRVQELAEQQVEKATTKVVNFYVKVGCGCGGKYDKYNAEVPINSDINDGDYLSDFTHNMTNIKSGWKK